MSPSLVQELPRTGCTSDFEASPGHFRKPPTPKPPRFVPRLSSSLALARSLSRIFLTCPFPPVVLDLPADVEATPPVRVPRVRASACHPHRHASMSRAERRRQPFSYDVRLNSNGPAPQRAGIFLSSPGKGLYAPKLIPRAHTRTHDGLFGVRDPSHTRGRLSMFYGGDDGSGAYVRTHGRSDTGTRGWNTRTAIRAFRPPR